MHNGSWISECGSAGSGSLSRVEWRRVVEMVESG